MPDITLCRYEECEVKKTCYRYLSKGSNWQSYFAEKPYKEGEDCSHYIEARSKSKMRRLDIQTEDK